jgi:hypothetical protein
MIFMFLKWWLKMMNKYCVHLLQLYVVKNYQNMSICGSLALSFAIWILIILKKNHQESMVHLSCPYPWPHTWQSVTGMPIMPLGLMYVFRLLYIIRCFRVMACLGFQLCWRLYKKPSSSLFLLAFFKFFYQWKFPP